MKAINSFEIVIGGENQPGNPPQYAGSTVGTVHHVPVPAAVKVAATDKKPAHTTPEIKINPDSVIWWQAVEGISDLDKVASLDIAPGDSDDAVELSLKVSAPCRVKLRIFVAN